MLPRCGLCFTWSSWLGDQSHGVCRSPFPRANEPHPLVRSRFDRDLCRGNIQDPRNIGSHLIDIRRNFRVLQNHRGIDVDNRYPVLCEQIAYVLEQKQARYAFEARIGIGKMFPDVPQARSTEQRIADGVQENIGIGMAIKPFFKRDIYPAQNEFSPGRKPMNIVPKADASRWLNKSTVSESAAPGGSAPSIQSGGSSRVQRAVPP